MAVGNRDWAQSGDMGALPMLYAATQDIPGDTSMGPNGPGEMRGYPGIANRNAAARDADVAKRLWVESERLTGAASPSEMSALAR